MTPSLLLILVILMLIIVLIEVKDRNEVKRRKTRSAQLFPAEEYLYHHKSRKKPANLKTAEDLNRIYDSAQFEQTRQRHSIVLPKIANYQLKSVKIKRIQDKSDEEFQDYSHLHDHGDDYFIDSPPLRRRFRPWKGQRNNKHKRNTAKPA